MAVSLPAVFQIEFDEQVKLAYQKGSMMRPFMRIKDNVVGKTVDFRRLGKGVARPHVPFTPRVPMGLQHSKVTATLTDWDATEYTDRIETSKVNFDEQPLLAQSVGYAIGRRMDQLGVDALVAAFVTPTIADASTGMTAAKARQIVRIFDDRAVPTENRVLLVSAKGYDDLRNENIVASRDFGETTVSRTGRLPPVYGMQVIMMEGRAEGGLPLGGGVRQCFAWDTRALGCGIGFEEGVRIDWVPHLRAWQINQAFSAGSVVIDEQGVIRCDITET